MPSIIRPEYIYSPVMKLQNMLSLELEPLQAEQEMLSFSLFLGDTCITYVKNMEKSNLKGNFLAFAT